MDSHTLRSQYLNFFKSQNHTEIAPAPLVPQDDPTTLFNSSGMQQLVPYLKGDIHPAGNRLVNSQPCFRSQDIDEVGDNRHTTFFEMLGNWSLGDYFKKDQLTWFFTFLTSELSLNPDRLYVSVFAGDNQIAKDEESIKIWQELFHTNQDATDGKAGFDLNYHIYSYNASKNWWSRAGEPEKMPVGEIGGPDSEIFYDFDPENKLHIHENSPFKNNPCHINCDCGRFLEIGNSVFMQFIKTDSGFKNLPSQNVDFGGGLERILAACNDTPDIFTTDLFTPIIAEIEKLTGQKYKDHKLAMRIIADHLRGACFIISQRTEPSNKAQGYFLRRLIRRSLIKFQKLGVNKPDLTPIVEAFLTIYSDFYKDLIDQKDNIIQILQTESDKFSRTLEKGLKEFQKLVDRNCLNATSAFSLYETFGFPFELTCELAMEKNIKLNQDDFVSASKAHADQSRTTSAGTFKGGLADNSEIITRYHTATHLLHQALRLVLGDHIAQAGSNITAERLRFDFTHPAKITDEQLKQIEALVNAQIQAKLPVTCQIMDLATAQKQGALAFFTHKYDEQVKVYCVGSEQSAYSREVCGGPHVANTAELGKFKLGKQKSIGTGKIRLYGYLE